MKTQLHMYQWLLICIIMVTGFGTVHANDVCGFDNRTMWYQSTTANARTTATTCEKPDGITLVLPVVAHVINESGSPLITREQMDSAMARINRDFANTNGFGPDTKIRFVWATRDTNGNPFDGVTYIDGSQWPAYVQHGIAYMPTDNGIPMEQLTQYNFPIDQYVNVFIVNKITGLGGTTIGGTLGGGGLIVKSYFFSKNSFTFAHEMGHFFNLGHTFSETGSCWPNDDCAHQGDGICDTPPYKLGETPSTGSVCYAGDISDSYYNVMGNSMTNSRFTAGQGQQMYSVVRDYLWSVVISDAVIPMTTTNELVIQSVDTPDDVYICGDGFVPRVTLRNIGSNPVYSFQIQLWIDGVLVSTCTKTSINFPSHTARTFDLDTIMVGVGSHDARYVIVGTNGGADYFVLNNSLCTSFDVYHPVYTVTTSVNNDGYTTGDGNYSCGTQVNMNAVPYNTNKYEFDRWTENGTTISTVSHYSFVVTNNRELTASFKIRSYTLTIANTTHGTVTGSGTFPYGTIVTALATPNYGYRFVGWQENGAIVSTDTNYRFNLYTNRNLVPQFQAKNYSITLDCNTAQGTVVGAGNFPYDTMTTVTAHARTGYRFVNWTENGSIVSTDSAYQFAIDGNRRLTANFVASSTPVINHDTPLLVMYPNPAYDWVTLSGINYGDVTVIDITGAIVSQETIHGGRIYVGQLPTGIYMIRVDDYHRVYYGKLLKQ